MSEAIISLTTINQRYKSGILLKTLKSLVNQNTKRKFIICLNISTSPFQLDSGFSKADINFLKKYLNNIITKFGKQKICKFRINLCNNYGSLRKLLPTLKLYQNNIIITVDDDTEYPNNMLESYINCYLKNDCIVTSRGRILPSDLNTKIIVKI